MIRNRLTLPTVRKKIGRSSHTPSCAGLVVTVRPRYFQAVVIEIGMMAAATALIPTSASEANVKWRSAPPIR